MRAREKIWVVRAEDGKTVADVIRRAGARLLVPAEIDDAIRAGRVFAGRRRVVRGDEAVSVGETIRIGAGPDPGPRAPEVTILFVKDELAFCLKPAGLSTVPDHAGARSLVTLAAKALGIRSDLLRVTSRLDHDVSGVVVFALSPEAEARLRDARSAGHYRRRYVALAHGALADDGVWTAAIGRGADPRLRAAVSLEPAAEAKPAQTRFARVATVAPDATTTAAPIQMLAVDPVTGRTHQIRVHASNAGAPLVGDRDYGGPHRLTLANGRVISLGRIALHAARVVVPGRTEPLEARAPIPSELAAAWAALGGEGEAWDRAVSCSTPPIVSP